MANDGNTADRRGLGHIRAFISSEPGRDAETHSRRHPRPLRRDCARGGQTLLREALLVVDRNAYHLGQLVFLRKMLQG